MSFLHNRAVGSEYPHDRVHAIEVLAAVNPNDVSAIVVCDFSKALLLLSPPCFVVGHRSPVRVLLERVVLLHVVPYR